MLESLSPTCFQDTLQDGGVWPLKLKFQAYLRKSFERLGYSLESLNAISGNFLHEVFNGGEEMIRFLNLKLTPLSLKKEFALAIFHQFFTAILNNGQTLDLI